MSLNEYIVLLWLHVYGTIPEQSSTEMWVPNAIARLLDRALIARDAEDIIICPRGLALIEHLKTMPMPVCKWTMP